MDLIYAIEPSETTLLVVMLLPFVYFGYQAKYWWNPAALKRGDFLLIISCILLIGVVVVRALHQVRMDEADRIQLTLMHLAPLVLTMLIISHFKRMGSIAAKYLGNSGNEAARAPEYNPIPANKAIEKLSWDELIINEDLKSELISVIDLLRNPKETRKYGIDVPKGILLTGPPGTGKTTIAKVMANEAGLNFFVLGMDEIVSKWVGESEKNLTRLFTAAQRNAPAVIFIDEVDSIGRGRSSGGAQWAENLLNHLLQLVDGVIRTEGLYIIAATNRDDLVDDALKRAGRLNKVIHIPLPDFENRIELFKLFLRKLPLEGQIDLEYLAQLTEMKSGADIKAICQQAGLNAFKRESGSKVRTHKVSDKDIEEALVEFMRQGPLATPSY